MKRIIAIVLMLVMLTGVTSGNVFSASATAINVDFSKTYQTMDGFGFFGAQDVWWGTGTLYSDAWLEKIISDLGITIWRNEIAPYNPVESNTVSNPQSANWAKQKNLVIALKQKAIDKGVALKVILSVWSPPGEFKINSSELGAFPFNWATRDGVHNSTLNGGTMNPLKYNEYAKWIVSALDMYKKVGVDVYGISLQNEPLYVETYNSCVYTSQWYVELINNVIPIVKASYPNVKVFGSENMLEGEATYPDSFYTGSLIKDPAALNNMDIFAFHGYADGVQQTAIAKHKTLWGSVYNNFYLPTKKPSWMTETSGFSENWLANGTTPGSLDLGIAISSALKYGKAAGWVYWQGSEYRSGAQSVFSLMDGTTVKKRYYVSKQFYKFIRPGAVMVEASTVDPDVLSTAFYEPASKNFTSVLINSSAIEKTITLSGINVPTTFNSYITTGTAGEDCKDMGSVTNGSITLPANSIMTLVATSTIPFTTPKPLPSLKPTLAPGATPFPIPAPLAPKIKTLTTASDTIFGTSINGGQVVVTINGSNEFVDVYTGEWDIALNSALKAGTKVSAKLILYNGQQSLSRTIYVVPTTPYVKAIKHGATSISGIATKGSIVFAKIGSKMYSGKSSSTKGTYLIKIPKAKKGALVSVKCKAGGRYSGTRTLRVV